MKIIGSKPNRMKIIAKSGGGGGLHAPKLPDQLTPRTKKGPRNFAAPSYGRLVPSCSRAPSVCSRSPNKTLPRDPLHTLPSHRKFTRILPPCNGSHARYAQSEKTSPPLSVSSSGFCSRWLSCSWLALSPLSRTTQSSAASCSASAAAALRSLSRVRSASSFSSAFAAEAKACT